MALNPTHHHLTAPSPGVYIKTNLTHLHEHNYDSWEAKRNTIKYWAYSMLLILLSPVIFSAVVYPGFEGLHNQLRMEIAMYVRMNRRWGRRGIYHLRWWRWWIRGWWRRQTCDCLGCIDDRRLRNGRVVMWWWGSLWVEWLVGWCLRT